VRGPDLESIARYLATLEVKQRQPLLAGGPSWKTVRCGYNNDV